MKRMQTEILVIGGGATGTGVAWDAALRGFRTVLVEKRDLTHGTTGRYHGLLHSGARYVLKDPASAVECINENRILRCTHTHCIEDTSGFFVVLPEDEDDYSDRFADACRRLDIPCTELPPASALRREPLLNPRLSRVFELPDAAADSFLATHATAQAARQAGATLLPYHELTRLHLSGGAGDRTVSAATVLDTVSGEELHIEADLVINAAGAWSGQVAALAGVEVKMILGKGVMLATNARLTNTVINRCKMPGDGDILVPIHTVSVIGTTDEQVADPENLSIEQWEIDLMLTEGDKLVPGLSSSRILRAWAGVRPLYQERQPPGEPARDNNDSLSDDQPAQGSPQYSRDATRALALLNHQQRDGVRGFITITGGKWTTFRLMAESAVDAACGQLGVSRPCRTAATPVPGVEQGHYWLGHRLNEVEAENLQSELVCECELVTRSMLESAAQRNPTVTLDDLRRDVRLGMGPCQGGFCTYRAVGILHQMRAGKASPVAGEWNVAHMQSPAHHHRDGAQAKPSGEGPLPASNPTPSDEPRQRSAAVDPRASVSQPNLLLRDFLQERWKGVAPILWGQQLRQERLDELIYLSILNADHLPVDDEESPLSSFYRSGSSPSSPGP
ncbi:MAG: anaerobic glycerol-3-phosphate dehydrogenase subunit GlpA [Caldilineaceae bacterium]|nr:anaerobic glycerol-3-phosphate dehydrogenase subunit GlpA [Caldilineaceae bacterium]MDE0337965.1 anaerobic glycerol-3-phosphate dehydrogenase subunit GlpA [Caldilineaceae bacterium]